ncbi:MAG: hypothetical protein HYX60_10910 [Legionella longbeachae]|nr:hypothetical protein [Legionella longbeachae]
MQPSNNNDDNSLSDFSKLPSQVQQYLVSFSDIKTITLFGMCSTKSNQQSNNILKFKYAKLFGCEASSVEEARLHLKLLEYYYEHLAHQNTAMTDPIIDNQQKIQTALQHLLMQAPLQVKIKLLENVATLFGIENFEHGNTTLSLNVSSVNTSLYGSHKICEDKLFNFFDKAIKKNSTSIHYLSLPDFDMPASSIGIHETPYFIMNIDQLIESNAWEISQCDVNKNLVKDCCLALCEGKEFEMKTNTYSFCSIL